MKKQKTKDLDGQQRLPGLLVEDWQKVFDDMAIGITASDKNGHFEIFNSKMQEITGYTLEQVNACSDFSRLIYPASLERQEALERLNEIIQKPEYHEIETQIQAKDGTKKILAVSTSLINYKDRVMFLSVYRDVTKRIKAEQTLKQVKDELDVEAWGLQKANEGIKVLYKELEQRTEEIKESEARFKAIFDNARDGILLADIETKKLHMWNKRICSMLGYAEEEMGRLSVNNIHPEKNLPQIIETFEKQSQGEIRLVENLPLKRKDGSIFYTDINSSVVTLSGKKYLMGNFRDITVRKKIDEALKAVNEKLKKAGELKSEFVATVSHELRTPLTTMMEFASIVSDEIHGKLTKEQKEYMDIIKGNIDRLTRLINGLLDISKIESGKIELKKALVDMINLANNVIHAVKSEAEEKHIELKVLFPAAVLNVYADPDKVVQVFTNLIGNAIKFTEKFGQITIEIKDTDKEVVCSVADTGRGIAPENLDKLFSKFLQFDREAGAGSKGTGLGLAISKGLIEMHNGRIWAESKIGEGSKFIFTLPKYSTDLLFKEYIKNGIKEAMEKNSKMSLIVFSIVNFDELKEELSTEKIDSTLKDIERILRGSLRRAGDTVVKGTGEVGVILAGGCNKENALIIASKLEKALDDYLTKKGKTKKIGLQFGCATYPDEAKNDDELIEKAKKS